MTIFIYSMPKHNKYTASSYFFPLNKFPYTLFLVLFGPKSKKNIQRKKTQENWTICSMYFAFYYIPKFTQFNLTVITFFHHSWVIYPPMHLNWMCAWKIATKNKKRFVTTSKYNSELSTGKKEHSDFFSYLFEAIFLLQFFVFSLELLSQYLKFVCPAIT